MLPGITVQLFIHKHPASVLLRPGAYRQGDVVAVYDGIPESKAELKTLVGNVCAVHERFAWFGVSDLTVISPAVQQLTESVYTLGKLDPDGHFLTHLDRARKAMIDYLSAPSATKAKILDKINLQTFTKAQIQTFIKNHT